MDLSKLNEILTGQPAYRSRQIKEAVYKLLVEDWDEVIGLPWELRQKLKEKCSLDINAEISVSGEGDSQKAVVRLADGLKIEAVLMCHDNRNTVCVSSQVGCPMACLRFAPPVKWDLKGTLRHQKLLNKRCYSPGF